MRLDAIRIRYMDLDRWAKAALAGWLMAVVVIGVRVAARPDSHTCYPIYVAAARHWLAGTDLYATGQLSTEGLDAFRYSPLIAALFTPLTMLPDSLGAVLWRLLNVGALVGGLVWWYRSVLSSPSNTERSCFRTGGQNERGPEFWILLLLVLPLSIGNFNTGQANPLVVGLLLGASAGIVEERWNLAGGFIVFACLLKVYPVAVGLLLVVLYARQLAGRLVLLLLLGLALPFLLQHPDYVLGQYLSWLNMVRLDDRHDLSLGMCYRDLQLLSRLWLVPMTPLVYKILQLAVGVGMAAICWVAQYPSSPTPFPKGAKGAITPLSPEYRNEGGRITLALGLGCCWMTVFGPATESSTYILLAPSLSWAIIEAWSRGGTFWIRLLLLTSYALLLLTCIACWFPEGRAVQALGLKPLAGLLLLGGLLATAWVELRPRVPKGWSLRPSCAIAKTR